MTNTNTSIVATQQQLPTTQPIRSLIDSPEAFAYGQRLAQLLAASKCTPQRWRNDVATCFSIVSIALGLGERPETVAQQMTEVHGQCTFSASFVIAMINKTGKFTPLRFVYSGEGDELACICAAKCKETDEQVESMPVSIKMAKDAGWYGRTNSHWPKYPRQMLAYRAATFFESLYCPEATMGVSSSEAVIDAQVEDITEAEPDQPAMPMLGVPLESPAVDAQPAVAPPEAPPVEAAGPVQQDPPAPSKAPPAEAAGPAQQDPPAAPKAPQQKSKPTHVSLSVPPRIKQAEPATVDELKAKIMAMTDPEDLLATADMPSLKPQYQTLIAKRLDEINPQQSGGAQ